MGPSGKSFKPCPSQPVQTNISANDTVCRFWFWCRSYVYIKECTVDGSGWNSLKQMNSGKSPSVDPHVQNILSRVTKTWPPRGTSKPRMSLCPTADQNKREIGPAVVAVPRRTTFSPTNNSRQQPPLAPLPLLHLGVVAKTVQEGSLPCLCHASCRHNHGCFKG